MDLILNMIKGTPWWVYLILIYLLMRGIRALKLYVISIKKMFIIPAIFLFLSIYRLVTLYAGYIDLIFWLFFLILGYIIGWGLSKKLRIRCDRKKLLVSIPGSPLLLILVLLIFATRYFFGAYSAIVPSITENFLFHSANIGSSGLISGIFLGRVFGILTKASKAPHIPLKESKK